MSFLRRRFGGNDSSSTEPSRDPTPDPDRNLRVVTAEKLHTLKKKGTPSKRKNLWIFGLGGVFGLLVAAFFAGSNDMLDLSGLEGMNLDSILDALPSGFMKDAQQLQKHERDAVNYDSFAVGLHAQSQGIHASHPVIMIPGVISTGLESWGTEQASRQYFRKRLWGSWTMMRALVLDKAGWKKHIMLDKRTGLDPPGIKLRAAQGFDATDFFITGYWIWNKILENLATIGYDPTNAFTAAYDWRMSYMNYEKRDQYFTRLKAHIEIAVRVSNKKVVLLSHSMGSQVLYYFFHWVEAEGYGNGGSDWVDTYVDSWINISGCMLGAIKGIPAVLSGEMKDTAQLNAFAVYGLEKFLARHERAELFRAMPGISSMLPIGGNAVWGDQTWAPDDQLGQESSFGNLLRFRNGTSSLTSKNLTVEESLPYLYHNSETWYKEMVQSSYSHGVAHTAKEVEDNQGIPAKWVNPLETRLPLARHLKIYCFYGVGKPTERAYYYKDDTDPLSKTNVTIDTAFTNGKIDHGVIMGEGDGTVNLLSSGYMCAKGWKIRRYNPAGVQIKTVEMPDEPDRFSPRGGPNTGDHVDILGRSSLNDLILRVAGGRGELIEESIHSNIREYAEKVKIYDESKQGQAKRVPP
ncbi:phospholipid:diacylglycerol acyltransferas-like protein [Trematosphaeria pertusa]|uniref:Phospholipid:diacylglycerol acyltransferas-like protein n=1 Tax=Trematosphaeria pertusa TaxID=390896 RepID=A0A6A6I376_9PLEO|nr:phospholipid:diacylglycerol acyltransferas-like protein [Trematosphaeria pertusa]KAF2244707.1 phospholipid:diacylglycerol acyltransferas-like protein [Trematosphaeria pertusa]